MADPLEVHQTNKATLESVAETLPPSTNPLLARGKLKKATKKPAKKKQGSTGLAATVQQVKEQELEVISADAVAGGEEAEVLDLADQLLAQLDGNLEDQTQGRLAVPTEPLQKSTSASSTGSTREKLHGMKEGVKDLFHFHSEENGTEQKVSRQKARKVSPVSPSTLGAQLSIPLV